GPARDGEKLSDECSRGVPAPVSLALQFVDVAAGGLCVAGVRSAEEFELPLSGGDGLAGLAPVVADFSLHPIADREEVGVAELLEDAPPFLHRYQRLVGSVQMVQACGPMH